MAYTSSMEKLIDWSGHASCTLSFESFLPLLLSSGSTSFFRFFNRHEITVTTVPRTAPAPMPIPKDIMSRPPASLWLGSLSLAPEAAAIVESNFSDDDGVVAVVVVVVVDVVVVDVDVVVDDVVVVRTMRSIFWSAWPMRFSTLTVSEPLVAALALMEMAMVGLETTSCCLPMEDNPLKTDPSGNIQDTLGNGIPSIVQFTTIISPSMVGAICEIKLILEKICVSECVMTVTTRVVESVQT